MGEAKRIADQHRRAFDGESWHGPHVFHVLDGVDAKQAVKKPIAGAHSIWEIVLHLTTWEAVVLRRLQGSPAEPSEAEDWPPVGDTGRMSWIAALASLRRAHDDLQRQIASTSDAALEKQPADGRTPLYRLIHGEIQHALYHAGQIAILKKG